MNPEAVEWLENQPLVHPYIGAFDNETRHRGPTSIRRMVEVIDDHEGPVSYCLRCGDNPIIV